MVRFRHRISFALVAAAAGISITAGAAVSAGDRGIPTCSGAKVDRVAIPGRPLVGTPRDDVLAGTRGADRIYGRGGRDTICGGGGSDHVYGNLGGDSIHGGHGADFVDGGVGDDTLNGVSGPDTLLGSLGADSVIGGSETDRLYGDEGPDLLWGSEDADRCYGGQGHDFCDGGAPIGAPAWADADWCDRTDVEERQGCASYWIDPPAGWPTRWRGTAQGSLDHRGLTETWSASFEVSGAAQGHFAEYRGGGTMSWEVSGVDSVTGCSVSGSATFELQGAWLLFNYRTQHAQMSITLSDLPRDTTATVLEDCPGDGVGAQPRAFTPLTCRYTDQVPYHCFIANLGKGYELGATSWAPLPEISYRRTDLDDPDGEAESSAEASVEALDGRTS